MWQNHVIRNWVVRNIYQTDNLKKNIFKAGNICHVVDSNNDKIKHDKNHPGSRSNRNKKFKKKCFIEQSCIIGNTTI
jgi:hypothetical protein